MYIREQHIIHIEAKDLKSKAQIFIHSGRVSPKLIWVHAPITVPEFLATKVWEDLVSLIIEGSSYAIITEWIEPMMMSLKNIQIRH